MSYGRIDAPTIAELRRICGKDNVLDDPATPSKFAKDQVAETSYRAEPEVVVKPASTDEVAEVVRLADRKLIPVTPRGGGSGLSGGSVPICGGISLSLERMNRIIEIDPENMVVVVQPGLVTRELDTHLKEHGLFFAGYPMSEEICQIGGNLAENAGGGRAVKYGVTADHVLGIEVVTPAGEIVRYGGKRRKDVAGYNMVGLHVGSEGTLGVVTEATISLNVRPAHRTALLAYVPDGATLADVSAAILRSDAFQPSAVEFMDSESLKTLRERAKYTELPEAYAAILMEVDGPDVVTHQANAAAKALEAAGSFGLQVATSEEDVEDLWGMRKRLPWAVKQINPFQTAEDVCVPVSELWGFIDESRALGDKHNIMVINFGHLADGNIHTTPIKPEAMSQSDWTETKHAFLTDLYKVVLSCGGTISGEHGIGHKRAKYLASFLTAAELASMRAVKEALDPKNIMNPGKIFRLSKAGNGPG